NQEKRPIEFACTHDVSRHNPIKVGSPVEQYGTMIIDVTRPDRPVETAHIPDQVAGGQAQMARMCLGSDLPGGINGHVYLLRNIQGNTAQRSGYEIWDVTDTRNPSPVAALTGIRSTHKLWWECTTGIAYMPGSKSTPPLWRTSQSMVVYDWSHPPAAVTGSVAPIYPSYPTYIRTNGLNPDTPSNAEIEAAQTGLLYMSGDQGGHTSMPVFGLTPASYARFTEFKTRDIVLLASEATANLCQEAPHWSFVVDVTVENSKTAPPGTRIEQSPWQGPMVLSTMWVDPRLGEKYPRGNYCTRGARYGVHSSEENFRNPFYGRVTFLAYFTGGVRAWDIREPQGPVEVGFYVPESNANTTQPDGYMTNNVEVDNRGFIYATDRNGSGLDILELRGSAKRIGLGTDTATAGTGTDGDEDR